MKHYTLVLIFHSFLNDQEKRKRLGTTTFSALERQIEKSDNCDLIWSIFQISRTTQ